MDFNGVIIDDEPLQMKAYQEILKGEDIDLTEEDYYGSMGMNDEVFLREVYKRAGKEPETNKLLELKTLKTQRWRDSIANEIPLFPDVENFVRKMEKEFALGIVSMARREEIEYVLEQTGLGGLFMTIVTAEDVAECKPNPECYKTGFRLIDRARTNLGSNPIVHEECLVIEDSPQGIRAGKAASLKTLGISNTVDAQKLRDAGADSVSKSLADWMPESINLVFG